jgi:hypothetical protein
MSQSHYHMSVFFVNFVICSQSGNHSYEDLIEFVLNEIKIIKPKFKHPFLFLATLFWSNQIRLFLNLFFFEFWPSILHSSCLTN